MPKISQKNHPLEGQYIIYKFRQQDSVGEAWALALFQLKNGKMDELYHPVNHVFQPSDIGEKNIEELLQLMEKKGIKKVFSVFHLDDFFGVPGTWFSAEEKPRGEEVEEWAEYKCLVDDNYVVGLLRERGIAIESYDATQKAG